MLVLVSFVLVLAAAVTLVVGLLQSGLTLIYLSIGCSVLAGVVLAVAVLRGRPEPRAAAAPVGRAYTPPPVTAPQQMPTPVAPAASTYESAPSYTPPPSPAPSPAASSTGPSDDAKAAGTALLGRLRRREPGPADAAPAPAPEAEPATAQYAAVSGEADDGFPIANYDSLRATDLLRRLGGLDRNQLEAVRERESTGKNRFTIMSRIDVLLAGMTEPAWEAAEDDWDDEGAATDAPTSVFAAGPASEDDDEDDLEEVAAGGFDDDDWDDDDVVVTAFPMGAGEMEDDEVDELVSPVDDFPIAGYESLTVGQILPRLSDLDADSLAAVRAREQQGRARGTILDRVDRLASKSGAAAMPAATRGRKAPARKAPASVAKAAPVPAVRKARVAKATPAPVPAATAPRKGTPRKAAATEAPMVEAVKKAARKSAVAAKTAAAPVVKKAPARRAPAAPAAESPMKAAVKKARAAKKQR